MTSEVRRGRPPKPKIDRAKVKASWKDIHPGLPQHERINLSLERLVDAICDEIEGK